MVDGYGSEVEVRRKFKSGIFLSILLFLFLFFMPVRFSDALRALVRDLFAPFMSAAAEIADVGSFFSGSRISLAASNERLTEEVETLKTRLALMQNIEYDNLMLRKQLGFYSRRRDRLLPCEIIGREFSGWWQTVILNRGATHGMEKGLPVVSARGLVGRVTTVSGYTSEALLITDPGCKVSVMFKEQSAYGVMSGLGVDRGGSPSCRAEFVSKDELLTPGDQVWTSGLGGGYPSGIPVGVVKTVTKDRSDLFNYVEITPSADVMTLKYVFAVKGDEDWLETRLVQKKAETELKNEK